MATHTTRTDLMGGFDYPGDEGPIHELNIYILAIDSYPDQFADNPLDRSGDLACGCLALRRARICTPARPTRHSSWGGTRQHSLRVIFGFDAIPDCVFGARVRAALARFWVRGGERTTRRVCTRRTRPIQSDWTP